MKISTVEQRQLIIATAIYELSLVCSIIKAMGSVFIEAATRGVL